MYRVQVVECAELFQLAEFLLKAVILAMMSSVASRCNVRIFCDILHVRFCHFLLQDAFLFTVNYRGSAGFGQDMVESLCGRAGDQDVKDVQVSSVSQIIPSCCLFSFMDFLQKGSLYVLLKVGWECVM